MGFLISKEFPSRFVTGSEIYGKAVDLTIKTIKKEKVFKLKEKKHVECLVVYFDKHDRGVLLGKERANDIKQIVGSDDTDDWIGTIVRMYAEEKDIFGKIVYVIRFKKP